MNSPFNDLWNDVHDRVAAKPFRAIVNLPAPALPVSREVSRAVDDAVWVRLQEIISHPVLRAYVRYR